MKDIFIRFVGSLLFSMGIVIFIAIVIGIGMAFDGFCKFLLDRHVGIVMTTAIVIVVGIVMTTAIALVGIFFLCRSVPNAPNALPNLLFGTSVMLFFMAVPAEIVVVFVFNNSKFLLDWHDRIVFGVVWTTATALVGILFHCLAKFIAKRRLAKR